MTGIAWSPEDPHLGIRYERPSPELAPYITAYDVWYAPLPAGERRRAVLPPAWPSLRFSFTDDPWSITIGRRSFGAVPANALFGASSHAGYNQHGAGWVISAGLTPLGWSRFVRRNASNYADRVVSLESVSPEWAAELRPLAERSDDPNAIFDPFFTRLLASTAPERPEVGALNDLLVDPSVASIAELADRLGMSTRTLAKLSVTHFGFTPKLLLRRARFMRALIGMMKLERGRWFTLLADAGYHDASHFVRDCQLFLGMPLSRFAAHPKALFQESIRVRMAVFGTPAQSLHQVAAAADAPLVPA